MRVLAIAWLLSSVVIMNLQSLPSLFRCTVLLVAVLLLAMKVRVARPVCAGIALSLFTTAIALLQLASHQLDVAQISTDLRVSVEVTGVPAQHERGLSFSARVLGCETCEAPLRVQQISLSWYGYYPEVRGGDRWLLSVRLKPPSSLKNKGGFDAVAFNLLKGVHARGYVRDTKTAVRLSSSTSPSLSKLRQGAVDRLAALTSSTSQVHLGLLQALTVGVKSGISDDQWDLLRDTGTAHLMAISGLHIGLVAAWALLLSRLPLTMIRGAVQRCSANGRVFDIRPWTLLGSLLAATVYAALAGFELPTQRAVLMLTVWVIAAMRFRFLPPFAALCLAMIALLATNALNVLSAGFWLSFGTVATLFYLHRGYQRGGDLQAADNESRGWWDVRGRLLEWLGKLPSVLRTHVLLGVVLLPVGAWFFQSGSIVSPVANMLAVPWVAMTTVPLGLMTLLASTFSDVLANALLFLTEGSLSALMAFLELLDDSLLSAMILTIPGPVALLLVLLGLLVILAPRGLGLSLLALPLFIPAVLHNVAIPRVDGFEVHVLDVGQGLSVLVYAGDHTLLFDTGGKVSPDLSMFEAVVAPFLQASGRHRIDTLVVSHGDEDHAFGVADVVRRYPDVQVYASKPQDIQVEHAVHPCLAGRQWAQAEVQFAFMHPAMSDYGSDNDLSCVLMVYMGNSRALLTGDIEASAEGSMLARLGNGSSMPVNMMTAPHHGSKSSSTQAFINAFIPDYVVFPAAERNRYGFPHSVVQWRYKHAGSTALMTGREGAVSFLFGPEGLLRPPETWSSTRRRFWHGIVNSGCWQKLAGESLVMQLHAILHKGKTLCGK